VVEVRLLRCRTVVAENMQGLEFWLQLNCEEVRVSGRQRAGLKIS
jgi:hypothetical protein